MQLLNGDVYGGGEADTGEFDQDFAVVEAGGSFDEAAGDVDLEGAGGEA
jgi:hypothetical protein